MTCLIRDFMQPVGDGPIDCTLIETVLDANATLDSLLARRDLDTLIKCGAWVMDGGELCGRLDPVELLRLLNRRAKHAVRDRDSARRSLAQQMQERKTLFANLSHELRTPLNAIVGYSDLIRSGVFGDIQPSAYAGYVDAIHESGEHLVALVDAVLDLAKIDANAMTLKETDIDVRAVLDQMARMVMPLAERRGVSVSVKQRGSLPRLYADERIMRQILLNLLSNAVKYTYADTAVTLTVRLLASGQMRFEVRDHGPGIDPDMLDEVMQPFTQFGEAAGDMLRSTGLGLPLVKALTELHDGAFELHSQLGLGTRAVVTLPASRVRHADGGRPQGEFTFTRAGSALSRMHA